jgi:hypothetical protein
MPEDVNFDMCSISKGFLTCEGEAVNGTCRNFQTGRIVEISNKDNSFVVMEDWECSVFPTLSLRASPYRNQTLSLAIAGGRFVK